MKTLFQIILRYALSAVGVLLLLIAFNVSAFTVYGWALVHNTTSPLEYHVKQIAQSMEQTTEGWTIPHEELQQLQENYEWAMLIDSNGDIAWSDRLPESLNHSYTLTEVASFTRWYLEDYPVYVYEVKDSSLLVLGSEQGSRWKYSIEMDISSMNYLLKQIPIWAFANLILAAVLILLSSVRFFRSIRRVAGGLSDLAKQQQVDIPEKGLFGSLYHDLNQTSKHLIQQQEIINQRDRMRTEWIAGVSHDVRTPLTIALGNAAQIESDLHTSVETREKAKRIRTQCERLRRLIEDLNLASKLTYHAQSIRKETMIPAKMLRQIAADFLNQNERAALSLEVMPDCEKLRLTGDTALLERAVRNLLLNSVQHNRSDCEISIKMTNHTTFLQLEVCDKGPGYPDSVLDELHQPLTQDIPTHGLGLSIVRQIMALHGGTAVFCNTENGAKAILTIPIDS